MVGKLKILLVEDNKVLYEGMIMLLEMEGYEVFHATNLQDSRTLYSAKQPHIVITDHQFPDVPGGTIGDRGFEVIDMVKQSNRPETKMIWNSGAAINQKKAIERGADYTLVKPFGVNDLLKMLSSISEELKRVPSKL